ncbi:NAD(P)/FAD-dependent oxidoreductase [Streptomyces sp. NPDC059002]|uniref:NAD(P)/FAD-dependent oxidoreductase n=1 Tax=Streptomyces sp. NPDC059002 TaxID=3346690 RepID=UPI00367FE99C
MSDEQRHYDVVVVGGGPAGASTAALLATEGRSVLVLEREKFPRYHIGESLIPGVWPTLDRLGLRERMENMGLVKKYGGTLVWGRDLPQWTFSFADGGPYPYAYQVRRADFDALLLTRTRELGAHVVEDATVKEPLFDGERVIGVRYQPRGGDPVDAYAKLVVDASGQQRWLGRHFDLIRWHEDLRNIAVWAYFQNCRRYEGDQAGNILIEYRPGGWLWFIPLGDGTTSIGYVTPTATLAESGLTAEKLWAEQTGDSREVSRMMEPATRVSGFRTIKDWSYNLERFHGPGWLAVGDAACFVDPLLSTGVTLALRGGATASTAAGMILDTPATAHETGQRYEDSYRRFLTGILDFVRAFYDQRKNRSEYYEDAKKILDRGEGLPANVDFVTLVSGLSDGGDFFEAPPEDRWELLEKLRGRVSAPPMTVERGR